MWTISNDARVGYISCGDGSLYDLYFVQRTMSLKTIGMLSTNRFGILGVA